MFKEKRFENWVKKQVSLNPNYLDKFNVELMKKLCKFNDDIYIGTTRAIASKLKDEGYEIINSLTGEVFVTDDNEIKHSFNLGHDFGKKFTEYRFGSNLEIYKNMLFCYKIGLDFHNEFSIGIFEPRKTLNNKINRDLIIKSL